MSRHDVAIVWAHGLSHLNGIIEELHQWDIRIVSYWDLTIGVPMRLFVEHVYSFDTVPMEHLRAKTKYLITQDPRVFVILFKNYDPQETLTGQAAFRHLQSQTLNRLKKVLRDRYNPRRPDGSRTEEHVIHFTDYEEQTHKLLSLFNRKPLDFLYRWEAGPIRCSPHILPFNWEVIRTRLEDLRVNVVGIGSTPLKDAPPYRYIQGDKDSYRAYWERTRGRECTEDHSPFAFDKMIERFTYSGDPLNMILIGPDDTILDGAHRASVLLARGQEEIEAAKVTSWV